MLVRILLITLCILYGSEKKQDNFSSDQSAISNGLNRVGDYGYPDNPILDRAKGYLLEGKVKSAISNYGNYIDWSTDPAGLWNNFAYLPNVTFLAAIPGHVYSSKWSSISYRSWVQSTININSQDFDVWSSSDAYIAWCEDGACIDAQTSLWEGNFATIVYNTVDDRGDIATKRTMLDSLVYEGGVQWVLDHANEELILYLDQISVDPNYASSLIGLAYPWSIRPDLIERTDQYDKLDYGEDREEWTADDNYVYYGANSAESWFSRDGSPAQNTDWQASEKARFNTHNTEQIAGDIFGSTVFTDPADPERLLAHSDEESTWPQKFNIDTGEYERFWPGWYADEYYGETESKWAEVGITDCERSRLDDDCWKAGDRHISDMDVYLEFDDRWAERGNQVSNNTYQQTGYPMGLRVMSMAHSYGISYAEDIMFVTVNVRNESGDFCAFERDKNGTKISLRDENDHVICGEAMVMPDGTTLNRSKGFDYKDVYLGFYMDADVLTTTLTGSYSVHTNPDDYMIYMDCLNDPSGEYYPDGCPEVNGSPLRISMAVIGDYDGVSNIASGYSMQTGENVGPDFGVVAVQLLDSPYATKPVDLDGDGFNDIFVGDKLKMTDWHWFDWYNRPGVVSGESNQNCCAGDKNRAQALNKEEIQYKILAGDMTNLSEGEHHRYFHSHDPSTDLESDINPHFDSLDGLKETSFFKDGDDGLDCVLEMSSGPFSIEVGETVSFSFSIIYGWNIEDLKRNARFGQIMYNSHYQGYTAPATPKLLAKPGHKKVELLWDDIAESSVDVITNYTDFEGYKIYKSTDGGNTWGFPEDEIRIENSAEGWQPYAQFDLSFSADSAFYVTAPTATDTIIRGTGISGPDPTAPWFSLGSDTGLENLLLDPDCWDCSTINRELYDLDWESKCNAAEHCKVDGNECIDDISIDLSSIICNADSALICDSKFNCCGISYPGTLQDLKTSDINEQDYPQCYECDTSPSLYNTKNLCLDAGATWNPMFKDIPTSVRYKYTDYNVFDGMEFTYSVVSYDMGVIPTVTAMVDTFDLSGNFLGYIETTVSIPDPDGWGKENSFETLESPMGTTELDQNFVTVIPGYEYELDLDNVQVVPNPYIVESNFNETVYKKKLRFTRLMSQCTIKIFTVTGELVNTLSHNLENDYDGDTADTGNEWWDLRTYNNQVVAPGLYIYVVEASSGETYTGKFAVVR
tara:strand:+ start:963 stop:4571 length:3609 start_codon:yes stop_codon:yes gene_type:complete